jgi:hypothetical protein
MCRGVAAAARGREAAREAQNMVFLPGFFLSFGQSNESV